MRNMRWTPYELLATEQRLHVLDLVNRVEAETHREALDETRRRGVIHGWKGEHWLRYDESHLIGYAFVQGTTHAILEMCGGGYDADLANEVINRHQCVDWWIRNQSIECGTVLRTLQMMSVALPATTYPLPPDANIRAFEPGKDDEAWLEQNNAAFANHPEQGAWRMEDLQDRIAEPWFDPSGFLLLDRNGAIDATCWTKVHELYAERYGEIYVLSVSPSRQGSGLGRIMLSQGLEHLRRKGVRRAIIYVDASNNAALRLYQEFGATVERQDQLVRLVQP